MVASDLRKGLTPFYSSPTQASDIYSKNGSFPKQRHVFLVRFNVNPNVVSQQNLTFAMKSCDRPAVQLHTEELHQYNKKRVVHTGYKLSPLKMQIYDTADSAGLNMLGNYTKYHFGDFSQQNRQSFSSWDLYNQGFAGDGSGNYGFIAPTGSIDSQYYFFTIEILHFYSNTYDVYTVINPKITSFTLDDVDYGVSDIATISVEFAYEALLFSPSGEAGSSVPEFSGLLNGNPINVPGNGVQNNANSNYSYDENLNNGYGTNGVVQNLFGPLSFNGSAVAEDFRTFSEQVGSSLGVFGNFTFGSANIGAITFGTNIANNLASLAISNPALAATLNLTANAVPALAYAGGSLYGYGAYPTSIPGTQLLNASVAAASFIAGQGYGSIQTAIAQGITGAGLLNNPSSNDTNGLVLSPSALSVINSQRPGSAQFGFNPNIDSNGQDYGYDGPSGYTGPSSDGNSVETSYAPAGSDLANALDNNPNQFTYGNTTYGPTYIQGGN